MNIIVFVHQGFKNDFLNFPTDEIQLQTLEWFTESKCDDAQVVVVNSFDKKLKRWRNPFDVPEKFKNYHNCTLTVASKIFRLGMIDEMVNYDFFIPLPWIYEQAERRDVLELIFIEVFAQRGNYSIYFCAECVNEDSEAHINHFTVFFRHNLEYYHVGTEFYEENYVLLMSPPQAYSSYEKMYLPLDNVSWLCIGVTFGVAFFVILLASWKKSFYNLLIGEDIKTPVWNLLAIFFGISLTKLPKSYFGRIILIFFVYFCLVIRVGYQGLKLM